MVEVAHQAIGERTRVALAECSRDEIHKGDTISVIQVDGAALDAARGHVIERTGVFEARALGIVTA